MSQDDAKLHDTLPDVKKTHVLSKCMQPSRVNHIILVVGISIMLILGVILLKKYIGVKNQLAICKSKS